MVKKTHNRIISLLFLPIAIMLFVLGWVMLMMGLRDEQKKQPVQAKTAEQDDGITIIPLIPEEIENN
jgi:hypothetical protein